ncbi:structural maintenance of chromosomes protein 6-like [Daphnia carinata]|uniref:structural maintenance of chromosomes protein 6-like n=1 Tax=Daphnia carinata TaxID=120202 RepID=UPI002580F075|nr:structural maintenance of chromosomes protein 6-like [Daphnia carinata]
MKRAHSSQNPVSENENSTVDIPRKMVKSLKTAGIVTKISLENFLCHDKLEVKFNEQINFIIGKNGSGKSAVLTGIVVALGERASATCRGMGIKDFVKTGKSKAVVSVTLSNKGQGSYKRDIFGDTITIERTINASTGSGGYKIINHLGKTMSTKRCDLDRILAKMNLQVDNPVCILNQETAKNFLHSNDANQKYKLFERATQMDVMRDEFSIAESELSRSKSCMKEKLQSLEMLRIDLKKWHAKKEWYEAINEIHDKKAKLENEILWAQVEDLEREVSDALKRKENQLAEIQRTGEKMQEQEARLAKLKEHLQTRKEYATEKRKELQIARTECAEVEKQSQEIVSRQREFQCELRQLVVDKQRLTNDKQALIKEIDKLKKAHGDGEYAQKKERRENELLKLKEREETLNSSRKVSEHLVEQLKGALVQLKHEASASRNELSRIQKSLDTNIKTLAELKKSDSNAYAVFGEWIPKLLQKIERTSFRGTKPRGPIGAYIKLRDKSWAPVVETFLGQRLSCFICSNDEDAKLLNRLIDEEIPRNRPKPNIITSSISGRLHDVSNYKVRCSPELRRKDIHCLMDMLIIDDPDIANILIDLNGIEQVLLICEDRDARHLLADVKRVPENCKNAITKEGNTYYPDPNYRSYCGKVKNSAQLLQASVEDAIRNADEEIGNLHREQDRIRQNLNNLSMQIQNNEGQLKQEETKLASTRREITLIRDKSRVLENDNDVAEPTDILALEEDLLDVQAKLDRIDGDLENKTATLEELKRELHKVRQTITQHQTIISSLMTGCGPLQDAFRDNEIQQRNIKEKVEMLAASLNSMQSKFNNFESNYEAAKSKAEFEAENATQVCARVPVTKSLKNLNSELRQLKEQIVAQEKEYGSPEYVLNEYRRRKADYERALSEITCSQGSLKKMKQMSKQRKEFISRFRNSIESRTHHVFQSLLKTRNFEGEIRFDSIEKTLTLIVTPPGREESLQPTSKRGRGNETTDIRSLSGGERSFATVCFILSLWDAIESPFRILDEFDVFMDHVNRSISMDLLITEARENSGRQFIFLTPLGLEKQQLTNMDGLSIFKMADPNRRDEEAI